MHQRVLLHLRRDNESRELELATRAVEPAKQRVAFRLAVAPQQCVKKSLPDTESDSPSLASRAAAAPSSSSVALRLAMRSAVAAASASAGQR